MTCSHIGSLKVSRNFIRAAPHCACLRGHGFSARPVGQQLGEDHSLGVRYGPVCPLSGLHCVSYHHLEEESHEVRRGTVAIHSGRCQSFVSVFTEHTHIYKTHEHTKHARQGSAASAVIFRVRVIVYTLTSV